MKWTGTRVDLVFSSNSAAPGGVYASADARSSLKGLRGGLDKVMNLDRFDLA